MLKVTRCEFVHNLPCEQVSNRLTDLEAENAKLRELVRNALTALDNNCAKCAYRDTCTILQDCKCRAPERLREDMRELGIEVYS